jgi:hypothetical protein
MCRQTFVHRYLNCCLPILAIDVGINEGLKMNEKTYKKQKQQKKKKKKEKETITYTINIYTHI